jgi:hypothetical protein
MIVDRDYVYVFGPEWADELLSFIERDPLAQGTMTQYGLTRDDLRSYYLAQPHFDRIYSQLLDSGDDFVADPVDTLLRAVQSAKETEQKVLQVSSQSNPRDVSLRKYAQQVRKMPRAGAVRNSVALFAKLLMS